MTERIKTFEDALGELGENNSFVKEYIMVCQNGGYSPDLMAYLKLRIICAALNEDWQPKFTEDEWRYYPWFWLYTKTKLEEMPEEDKKKLVIIDTGDYDTEYAGFGSHLCFKNSDLAEYCGTQFINLWADYLLRRK